MFERIRKLAEKVNAAKIITSLNASIEIRKYLQLRDWYPYRGERGWIL